MNITVADIITWLIVGGLAGSMVGMLVKAKKQGFGIWINMGVGLVGALIGGVVFTLIPVARPLAALSINLEDLVSALVGSLIFLLVIRLIRKQKAKAKIAPATPGLNP